MNQFFVGIGEYKARVCEWGDKNNSDIVCFHGMGSTCMSFIEVAENLKDSYHVLSVDLPGHGKSESFENDEDYEASNLIKWVDKVIDQIGIDSFNIVSHSWGGSVALHYAAEYPERVKKIVLIDGGYYEPKVQYDYFKTLYEAGKLDYRPTGSLEEAIKFNEKDYEEYIFDNHQSFVEEEKANCTRWSELLETAVYDLMREEDGKIKWHASGDTARGVLKSLNNLQKKVKFENIKSDILLLYAGLPEEYLEINSQMVKEFEKKIKVNTKLYRDATHMIHWDKPNKVSEEIANWFERGVGDGSLI
ncbi:alpha/beta hydrolase [Oceanirhabdus seepicola]|uniref:Alpha/beta hydrolase n=1 Tax=Oceanirhabdus seepicola TaxID=2828781 RepID=A0A9J6P0L9_9CLOT|nr:alpha/beta hydrolase [Oceanirhabdus seepicola]MCM1989000.1 alpha/beta hydrolase [Oceanirhabdus seepicola]